MDLALQLEQEFTSTHDRFIESWEACNQSFLVLNNMASGTQKPLSDLTRRADTLLHHVTWFRTCYSVDVARLEIEISTFGENHSEHWLRLNARDLTALVRQLSLPQHEVGSEKSPEVDARHLIAVVASLLSKEPSSKAKKMSAFEYSTLTFVHTSLKVVQALTTRLDPLQPKSNSIGKFLRESRRYLSSSFPKAAKLNREHTPEPDTLKGNNAAETIEDENTENSHQSRQLEPPCVPDTKGVESICEDSNEEQPSESEFISRLSTSGVEELSSEFFRFKQQKFQAALRAVDHFHSEWQAVDEQGRSAIKRLEESSSLHERQYHQLDSKLCDMFLHLQNGIENLQSRQQELQRKRASAHLSVRWSTSQALDDLWLLVLRCISAPQEPNKRNTVKDALAELQRLKSTLKRYSSSEAFSSFTDNNGRFTEASYIPLSLAEELAKANSDQSVAEAIKSEIDEDILNSSFERPPEDAASGTRGKGHAASSDLRPLATDRWTYRLPIYTIQQILTTAFFDAAEFICIHVRPALVRPIISRAAQYTWICILVCVLIFGAGLGWIAAMINQAALEVSHKYMDYEFRQMLRRDALRRVSS